METLRSFAAQRRTTGRPSPRDADDETNEIAAAYAHEVSLAYEAQHLAPVDVDKVTPGVDATTITGDAAMFNPGEGWVDRPSLIGLLLADFTNLGGTLITTEGSADVIVENNRAASVQTKAGGRHMADAVLIATGPAVPAMAVELGVTILVGTPVALLLTTKPIDHPLKAVLNTPRVAVRPAPGGALVIDADWAANKVVSHADSSYDTPIDLAAIFVSLE